MQNIGLDSLLIIKARILNPISVEYKEKKDNLSLVEPWET